MMDWLVNFAGVALIFFIIWWFWLSRPQMFRPSDEVINIKVADGVYTPANIEIRKMQDVILRFQRFDETPCAEIVQFHDLNIRLELPLNESRDIHLCIESPGKYRFSCDMGMYQGALVVK